MVDKNRLRSKKKANSMHIVEEREGPSTETKRTCTFDVEDDVTCVRFCVCVWNRICTLWLFLICGSWSCMFRQIEICKVNPGYGMGKKKPHISNGNTTPHHSEHTKRNSHSNKITLAHTNGTTTMNKIFHIVFVAVYEHPQQQQQPTCKMKL